MNRKEKILVVSLLMASLCLQGHGLIRQAIAAEPTRTLYRIRVEEGIKVRGTTLTAEDRKALDRLDALLKQWPQMLWIADDNGRLVVTKMGGDGKPQ